MASSAPSGPMTQAQKSSDTNVRLTDSPTVSPTTFGWMTDWITTLMIPTAADVPQQPPVRAGGMPESPRPGGPGVPRRG